jgi:UDP-N-acetylmuramyl pentapeptide synthase
LIILYFSPTKIANFNLIIAVGVNASFVKEGASSLGADVICVEQTKDAQNIIKQRTKRGDVVAFFNDLPDKY